MTCLFQLAYLETNTQCIILNEGTSLSHINKTCISKTSQLRVLHSLSRFQIYLIEYGDAVTWALGEMFKTRRLRQIFDLVFFPLSRGRFSEHRT